MKKIIIPELEHLDFFVSSDRLKEEEGRDLSEFLEKGYSTTVGAHPEYKEIFSAYGKKHNLDKETFLDAHEGIIKNGWGFRDSMKKSSVKGWIKRNDGKYSVIVLSVCNSNCYKPTSKKSILLYGLGDISPRRQSFAKDFNYELFVPGEGIIDSYSLEYYLNKLKS